MTNQVYNVTSTARLPSVAVNRVLRNTYALLAMLFVAGAATAYTGAENDENPYEFGTRLWFKF